MDYFDFELEIGPGDGLEYQVKVVRSPAGEARATMTFPFGQLELQNKLQTLENALLRSGSKRRMALAPEQQAVQEFGRDLCDALLTGDVRSVYDMSRREAEKEGRGLRLKLRIHAPELAALPWEFIHDQRYGGYVCLSTSTPLVRYMELPRVIRPFTVSPPLRILGMIVSPRDKIELDVDIEKQRVEKAVAVLQADGLVELTWLEGQTRRALQSALRKGPWHIFHFIGHGGFDRNADEGIIALADDNGDTHDLRASQLSTLLADHRSLRLVLLNACEGARGGSQDILSSTASILVKNGVPAVLAMQYEISDWAAIEIARAFYEALADGLPVDAAVAEARKAIHGEVENTVEWGTPVLYMRAPDGVLFRFEDAGRVSEEAIKRRSDKEQEAREREARAREEAEAERQAKEEAARKAKEEADRKAKEEADRQAQAEAAANATRLTELCTQMQAAAGRQDWPDVARLAEHILGLQPGDANATQWVVYAREQMRRVVVPPPPVKAASPVARLPFEPELILIPAGEFLMGSDKTKDPQANDDELPQHTLYLPDYYIAKTPTTNAQYAAFVQATGHKAPRHWKDRKPPRNKDDHPVVEISWNDVMAYCTWLSEVAGKPYMLTSEAEWEKAARGADGRIYPWGYEPPDKTRGNFGGIVKIFTGNTTPVGKYSPRGDSPYGCVDMAGNVWNWTRSLAQPYPYDLKDGREDLRVAGSRVARGGGPLATMITTRALRTV